MINDSSPNEREYLAAATGIAEQTPLPEFDLAVGDFISGVSGGKRWQGRVDWIAEDGRICIDVGGGWVYVSQADITH